MTQRFFISIALVRRIGGNLATQPFKTEGKGKTCTLYDKLGAFLMLKDFMKKCPQEKHSKKSNGPGEEATTAKSFLILMLALDKEEQIGCTSCGYPTLRMFGPEKHLRFGRPGTCSATCFNTMSHYREEDETTLQHRTVKSATDSLRAICGFAVKTLRRCNAEEVLGSCGRSLEDEADMRRVHEANQEQLARLVALQMSASVNSLRVGKKCNTKLLDAKTFDGTVMGGVDPPLFGSKRQAKKWSTAVGEIRRRKWVNLSMLETADVANSGTVTGNRPLPTVQTQQRMEGLQNATEERETMPTVRMAGSQSTGPVTQSHLTESELQKAVRAAMGEDTKQAPNTAESTDFGPTVTPSVVTLNPLVGSTSEDTVFAESPKPNDALPADPAAPPSVARLHPLGTPSVVTLNPLVGSTSEDTVFAESPKPNDGLPADPVVSPSVARLDPLGDMTSAEDAHAAENRYPHTPAEDAAYVTQSYSVSGQSSTPTHGAKSSGMKGPPGDSADLLDTPEPQLPKKRGPGRLKRNQPDQPAKKVDTPPPKPTKKAHDGWTFKEGKEQEYGVSRNCLNAQE